MNHDCYKITKKSKQMTITEKNSSSSLRIQKPTRLLHHLHYGTEEAHIEKIYVR